MCGIAGVLKIYQPGEPVPPHHGSIPDEWLDTLDESIKHRGPDGAGRFRDRAARPDGTTVDVALVHRRLSIIDHAGGAQPMVHLRHPDGTGELLSSPTPPPSGTGFQPVTPQSPNQRAPRASEGTQPSPGSPHAPPLPDPTPPRSLEGLTPHTIDATTLPQGTDLIAVAFNGCIYNHRDLRADLDAAGHRFHTDHADTEVLIHGWREHGPDLTERLVSMHAFAVWDRNAGVLFLHRATHGEKPLYHAHFGSERDSTTVFGSTVPGVHSVLTLAAHHEPRLNRPQTAEYITYGFFEPTTPFDGIEAVPSGFGITNADPKPDDKHPLRAAFESWTQINRKDDATLPRAPMKSFALATAKSVQRRTLDALDEILASAVVARLDADVPVACLLSGGIDSSLITHYATDAIGDIPAITVRMPDAQYDESEAAAEIASHIGCRHEIIEPSTDASGDLVRLIETLGLPFGDSSLLPTHWACTAAAQHASVLLTGDGGDEMFVGYDRHIATQRINWLGAFSMPPAWLVPAGLLPGRNPKGRADRLRRLILAVRRQSYDSLLAIFPAPDAASLLGHAAAKPFWFSTPRDAYDAALYDRAFTLPGDYLRKVDTASMTVPAETRAPLLDPRISEACDRIGIQLTNGGPKALLRALARRHLPDHIINRPKQGFAIPIGDWFRTDFGGLRTLLHDHLLSADPFPGLADAGINIDLNHVRRLLREHDAAGERSLNPWHGRDHSQRLYMLLVLSIWSRWLARLRGSHTASPDRDPTGPTTTLRTSE